MNASPALYPKQYRLAWHYLDKLRTANRAYRQGDENTFYSLKLVARDWPQMQQWQAWSAARANQQHEAAVLCSAYPYEAGELLELMMTPTEHRVWRETALAMARRLQDAAAETAHLLALGEIYEKLDLYPLATEQAQAALTLARRLNDRKSVSRALEVLGLVALRLGQYVEADALFAEGLAICRAIRDQEGIARQLSGQAHVAYLHGDPAKEWAGYEEMLHIHRILGNRRGMSDVLNILAEKHMDRGQLDESAANLQEALRIKQEINDRVGISIALANLGRVAILRKDYAVGKSYTEQALLICRQMDSTKGIVANLLTLAGTGLLENDFVTTVTYSEETLSISRKTGNAVGIVNSLVYLAYGLLGQGNGVRARPHLLEGIRTVREIDSTFLNAELVTAVALLRLQMRDPVAAARLIGVAQTHPNIHQITRKTVIPPLLITLEKILGAEGLASALESGRSLRFETVLDTLSAELAAEELSFGGETG